jgi:hypothetical protein
MFVVSVLCLVVAGVGSALAGAMDFTVRDTHGAPMPGGAATSKAPDFAGDKPIAGAIADAPRGRPKWLNPRSSIRTVVEPDGSRHRVWECRATTKDRVNLLELTRRPGAGAPCAPPSGKNVPAEAAGKPGAEAQDPNARSMAALGVCWVERSVEVLIVYEDGSWVYIYIWVRVEVPCPSGT